MLDQNGISTALVQDQPGANARSRAEFSESIWMSWTKGAAGIVESCLTLKEAKDELEPKQFKAMTLPFDASVARKLMVIGRHALLCAHVHILPPCWSTIYELSKVEDPVLRGQIEDGTINTKMQRKDAIALRPRAERRTRSGGGQAKPELLKAWFAASREDQQRALNHLGTTGLLKLIPETMRTELEDRLLRQEARGASTRGDLAKNCTKLLRTALRNAQDDHTNEAINALNGIMRKLMATGRDSGNAVIAIKSKTNNKNVA